MADRVDAPDPFVPARLGPVQLRNRTIKAATFEHLSHGGRVTDELIEYHRRPAAGGVGATTLAYVSVSPEGRTYRDQLVVDRAVMPGLRRFTDVIHDEGAAAAVQLGHAGWFADPKATRRPPMGPSRLPNPHAPGRFSKPLDEPGLQRLLRDFATAGRLAAEAGFDVLEVHLGHGYLLSQFLSPFTNRRKDRWGGDLEGRAAFPRQAVQAVRDGAGADVAVIAKLNMSDGFKGGMRTEEAVQVAGWLAEDGALDALELTGGFTGRSPMYLLRGEPIIPQMAALEPELGRRLLLKAAARTIGGDYPFQEAFFKPKASQFLDCGLPIILLGGITRRDTIEQAMADGFGFVAMARALLRDPDLVDRMAAGDLDASRCTPCNRCIAEMDHHGARCPFWEAEQPDAATAPV